MIKCFDVTTNTNCCPLPVIRTESDTGISSFSLALRASGEMGAAMLDAA
jgi:hypothetical protein